MCKFSSPLFKFFLVIVISTISQNTFSQDPNWRYFRAANTGVCGEEHNFISSDRFGNIWTNGRSVGFLGEASVIRFNWQDTIFTCWSDFEGYLPSDFINDAKVDSLDVLWVATGEGLCRFNGTSWATFDMSNTPLPSENIRSVSFDYSGNVWITFQEINMNIGGVAKFDGANWEIFTPNNSSLPNHECNDVWVAPDNSIWIQSQFSMTHFDGLNFQDYNNTNSPIAGNQIYDSTIDENGILYVVTQGPQSSVVSIFDGIDWTEINSSNNPYFATNTFYGFDAHNSKMIFSGAGVVLIFDGLNWQMYPSNDTVFDVHIDNSNNFWVASMSTLSLLTETGWKDYSRFSSGISEDFNENIFIDSQNRFWTANGNGGVHIFDCPKWQMFGPYNQGLYPSPQSLSTLGSTVCEDSFGNIWFAYNSTSGTVVKIPNGDYQNYDAWVVYDSDDFPISYIEESVADGFGNVFFYSDYGTFMYSNVQDNWTFWDLTNTPLQYYTYGFGTDNFGVVYFGGFQQISTYNNGVWDLIDLTNVGSGFITVNDIEFDDSNTLWLATDEGVWKRENDLWTNWNTLNSNIISNNITSLEFSYENELWVSGYTAAGFLEGGIGKLNTTNNTWSNLNTSNSGLAAEQIDDITFDLLGNLWINSYPRGISVYNENGLVGFECQDYSLQGVGGVSISEYESEENVDLKISPNPCSDAVQIQFTADLYHDSNVSCYNTLGQIVLQIKLQKNDMRTGKFQIDVSSLPEGTYFIRLQNGQAYPFIKQNF
jgi:ligand-binding sensor domain-containing protein